MIAKSIRLFCGNLKKRLMDLKISMKIMLLYFIILLFSISISSILYQKLYTNTMSNKVSGLSIQILYSISANFDSILGNVNSYSKAILSDEDLQGLLREGNKAADLRIQRRVNYYLTKLTEVIPSISSVYIFDYAGNKYAQDKVVMKNLAIKSIVDAPWHNEVLKKRGGFILKLNAGGVFGNIPQGNYLSLIRVINDVNTQKTLGILIVNISEEDIWNSFQNVVNQYDTEIIFKDEDNRDLITTKRGTGKELNIDSVLEESNDQEYFSTVRNNTGKDFMVSCLKMSKYNWRIVSIVPFLELSKESKVWSLITIIVLFINSLLIFIGSLFVSKLITTPIKKLLVSMKGIETGEFNIVNINAGKDEIGKLRDGYNVMIGEIQKLINRIMEEQKVKRKAELDVLQAQIKPHFLYNTFDSISALARAKRNEDVYTIIRALGKFYRTSLSKGSEVVTVAEELDVVRNYLTIQKIRYKDSFEVHFDCDERINSYKILKLVLQPLVENALYHGIKLKGSKGLISIRTSLEGGCVRLTVEDNGVGMAEEQLRNILTLNEDSTKKSFGLRGTIERLKIFYGKEDIFFIKSKKDVGTLVGIEIPLEKGWKNAG